jgi:hypothetical protein
MGGGSRFFCADAVRRGWSVQPWFDPEQSGPDKLHTICTTNKHQPHALQPPHCALSCSIVGCFLKL